MELRSAHPASVSRRASRNFGLLRLVLSLVALRRQRRQLARMEAHMLDDIGINRDEAMAEAARPIWDAPPHWRL